MSTAIPLHFSTKEAANSPRFMDPRSGSGMTKVGARTANSSTVILSSDRVHKPKSALLGHDRIHKPNLRHTRQRPSTHTRSPSDSATTEYPGEHSDPICISRPRKQRIVPRVYGSPIGVGDDESGSPHSILKHRHIEQRPNTQTKSPPYSAATEYTNQIPVRLRPRPSIQESTAIPFVFLGLGSSA